MAAVEVPQTLEYRGGKLNAAPVLEMKISTNRKKEFFMIIGIEPQFENIISNGLFIPMADGQRKPEGQWTDFQDSPDDVKDTRSIHEYLNDLEEEYQARALLDKSKRSFCKRLLVKTSVPSYQSPFQSKLLLLSENKPEPRQIKDFESKYHKVKAKLAILSSSDSTPRSSSGKNKGLIAETYDWDDEEIQLICKKG
ncbi:hypothetical protein Tco_0952961 [Tanacetum coccineum]|uniref:Uncharacterized protein n=1 Tax=Tanacetum coccineum TaxID=301880 RepID=A0ABQ5DYJ5_9ASTR